MSFSKKKVTISKFEFTLKFQDDIIQNASHLKIAFLTPSHALLFVIFLQLTCCLCHTLKSDKHLSEEDFFAFFCILDHRIIIRLKEDEKIENCSFSLNAQSQQHIDILVLTL